MPQIEYLIDVQLDLILLIQLKSGIEMILVSRNQSRF